MLIERKAMIRNRCNYLMPSVQDTKGKEKDVFKAKTQQSKHYKQKAKKKKKKKKKFLPQTLAKRLSKINNKHFTRTIMQRRTMKKKVNHSRSTPWNCQ